MTLASAKFVLRSPILGRQEAMDDPARKAEAIYEEFNQLLKRWGDKNLESLIKEARERHGDRSPLGAAVAGEGESDAAKSKTQQARPKRRANTERVAGAPANADDDLVATLNDEIVTKLKSRISESVASALKEMAEKVQKMDR